MKKIFLLMIALTFNSLGYAQTLPANWSLYGKVLCQNYTNPEGFQNVVFHDLTLLSYIDGGNVTKGVGYKIVKSDVPALKNVVLAGQFNDGERYDGVPTNYAKSIQSTDLVEFKAVDIVWSTVPVVQHFVKTQVFINKKLIATYGCVDAD